MHRLTTLLAHLGFSLSLLAPVLAAAPVVTDCSGLSYVGLHNATAGQDYFLGIPFAQPPVGSLRFKPPVVWSTGNTTTVNATREGNSCEQASVSTTNSISEDCLTLNIWKPTNTTGNIPVMVWIYGGGFYVGDIYSYPGTFFVERSMEIGNPVIYVAMNYRVGLYGFPPGQAAATAGALNLGLKDQRLALEWVQANIGYFGGDPDRVTIFGNSAGAISSSYQSLYKGGDIGGAFRGMILGSGAPSTLDVRRPNDTVREQAFQFIANATGCAGASNQFECVRAAPADALSQANKDVVKVDPNYNSVGHVPVTTGPTMALDDDFLPDKPAKLIHSGKFAKVPFISGNQLDEGTVFVNGATANTDQDIINAASAVGISSSAMTELLEYYPVAPEYGSPYNTGNQTFGQGSQYKRFASIYGDYAFQAARRDHLKTAQKFGVQVWSYIMSERPLNFVPLYGIRHGGNVPFIMQSYSVSNTSSTPAQVDLQQAFGDYLITFAYNLDPNLKAELERPSWPPYGSNSTALQLLSSNVTLIKDSNRTDATDFIINLYG